MGLQQRIIIGVVITLVILIPVTSFVISYRFRSQTKARASKPVPKFSLAPLPIPDGKTSLKPQEDFKNSLNSPTPSPTSPAEVFFGPTLSLKLSIEGRPASDQSAEVFIGIGEGQSSATPQYLLSFSAQVPASGAYSGLSLAGLSTGNTYTAYIKAPAQITTALTFTLKPAETDLGTVKLTTGDLNEDNLINTQDYSLAKAAFNSTPDHQNWNPNADFNLDQIVNNIDLAIIIKNMGKTGESGPFTSTVATGSAIFQTPKPIGKPQDAQPILKIPSDNGGFWLFVPN